MFKILVGFPSKNELKGIVDLTENRNAQPANTILTGDDLQVAAGMVNNIGVADAVMDTILEIIMGTHDHSNKYIREGASPRAAQAIVRGAKARAFMEGRYNVSFDDVEAVAYPVLRHRILLSFDAISEGVTEDKIITGIIRKLSENRQA